MPQLCFSVSELLARRVQDHAEAVGLSTSRYLAELVQREVGSGWPAGYFERVVGGWQGDELTRPEQPVLEQRDRCND
jgi:hypothetical protein